MTPLRRATPLRATLLALSIAVLIYVALIGGFIVFGISPSASRLQGRSSGLLVEYEGSQQRAQRLDLARTGIRELLQAARSGPVPPDSLAAIRLGLQATADSSRTVERVALSLGDSPRLRGILTNSVADESRLRGALLGAVAAIELGELSMAERVLRYADSVDRSLNRTLSAATVVALQNVTRHEGALAETAGNAARLVWAWVAGGLIAVPLLAVFFRRRLYAPLAELDQGMARVAAGDLDVHLSPERNDELGRLRGHFNEMTGVLRLRASEAEQRTADETAARTRLILDAALDAVIVMDMEGRIREWNPQAEVVFGWARSEVLGRLLADTVIPPELRAGHSRGLARYLSTGQASILGRRLEIEAIRRDGSRFPVELAVIPIQRGKQLEFSAFLRDITERRASATALTASEERYRAAFEQAAVGMAEVNPEGRFLRVNPAFGNIVGRSVEELTGMTYEEITHPDDLANDRIVFQSLWKGRAPNLLKQKRYLRKDGTIAWVQLASAVVRNSEGEPGYALTVFQDVTAQKRLEADLVQAQKLDAVGRLAGGIAHDFNNLLTAIIGYADLLVHAEAANPRVQEDAGAIVAAARRGADLARNLLSLARRRPERTERVDLNAVAGEVEALVTRTFDRRITVKLELSVTAPILSGDRSLLTNALLNLALNARDAMPDGGTLRIATRRVTLDAGFMARRPEVAPPGRYACLVVADTGIGMTPDTRQRIFEPFFTTKPAEKGTGLGLAMVYGTIRAHRGFIDVSSAPGDGTTFTIYLPEAEGEAETVAADPGRPVSGAGRILLVDDEETVRTVVARMLGVLGFEVTTAPDGEDAVALVAASPQRFDLVILDGNMPRVPGREAARQIRMLAPSLPLLLATGYLEPGAVDGLEADGFSGTLVKPYDLNQLSQAVARYLPGHQ